MEQRTSGRNQTVDILRGIAMLLVVLGHTLTGCTVDAEKSFLFNVIWTLQMPLFFLISGYVTKYSRKSEAHNIYIYIFKKTVPYLLPWAVWTFLVRGIIFGEKSFLNIAHLAFHMDSGYWFLFSLWTMTMIQGLAQFSSEALCRNAGTYSKIVVHTTTFLIGMAMLAVVGICVGMSFLCIKLTLYYMPFYIAGFLFGQLDEVFTKMKFWRASKEVAVALSLGVWLFLLNRFNFFEAGESVFGIAVRAMASLLGCVAICGLTANAFQHEGVTVSTKIGAFLSAIGKHSLEIYLIHGFALSMLLTEVTPEFESAKGILLTLINFVFTVSVTYLVSTLLNKNRYLCLALFGKKQQ